jgi:hypothetical protein
MSRRQNPVVVMINRNERTGDLSFQFGLLRRGRIEMVKYWREEAIMQMALLAKVAAELAMGRQLGGIDLTGLSLKKIIDDSPHLEWVENFIPQGVEKKAGNDCIRRRVSRPDLLQESRPPL